MLNLKKLAQLMAELKKIYDFVFIDFPPIGIVSDAAAVANCITGYLFVVRENHSDSICVKDAIEKLENVDANILGLIFNELDYKDSSYGKGYSRSSKYARQGTSGANE